MVVLSSTTDRCCGGGGGGKRRSSLRQQQKEQQQQMSYVKRVVIWFAVVLTIWDMSKRYGLDRGSNTLDYYEYALLTTNRMFNTLEGGGGGGNGSNRNNNANADNSHPTNAYYYHQHDTPQMVQNSLSRGYKMQHNNDPNACTRCPRNDRSAKYAYAFLLGVCDPAYPKYKGYLYGISIIAHLLRSFGSQADFVVFVEMYHGYDGDTLPPEDAILLDKLGFKVYYSPKIKEQSFYRLILQKMRILGLTQYRRVLFMDADLMPLANLDYWFEYSDPEVYNPPLLQENMVTQGPGTPANAGFFMFRPHLGDIELMTEMIQDNQKRVYDFGRFDNITGWGPLDYWEGSKRNGTAWNFWGAEADQGLIYHWMVNIQKKGSFIQMHGGNVQEITLDETTGKTHRVLKDTLVPRYEPIRTFGNVRKMDKHSLTRYFEHFMGDKGKPWQRNCPKKAFEENMTLASKTHFWYASFHDLVTRYNLTQIIDVQNLDTLQKDAEQPGVSNLVAPVLDETAPLVLSDLTDINYYVPHGCEC